MAAMWNKEEDMIARERHNELLLSAEKTCALVILNIVLTVFFGLLNLFLKWYFK